MASAPPRTPFEIRREVNNDLTARILGYRQAQVVALINEGLSFAGVCDRLDMDPGNLSRTIARLERRGYQWSRLRPGRPKKQ